MLTSCQSRAPIATKEIPSKQSKGSPPQTPDLNDRDVSNLSQKVSLNGAQITSLSNFKILDDQISFLVSGNELKGSLQVLGPGGSSNVKEVSFE